VTCSAQRRASAGQGCPGGHRAKPVADTVAWPTPAARRSASSLPEDCRCTFTTSMMAESLVGVSQRNPGSSTMWMVTPTWVATVQGWAVIITSGLTTTPQGGAAGPVVVGPLVELLVEGLVVGLPLGGMPDEPHAANKTAMVGAARTRGRFPKTRRSDLGMCRFFHWPLAQSVHRGSNGLGPERLKGG